LRKESHYEELVYTFIFIMYIWHAEIVHSSFLTIIYSVIQIMNLLNMRFPLTPLTSSALGPHILLSTLNMCFLDMHSLRGGFLPEILVFNSAGHVIHRRRFIPYAAKTTWITLSV